MVPGRLTFGRGPGRAGRNAFSYWPLNSMNSGQSQKWEALVPAVPLWRFSFEDAEVMWGTAWLTNGIVLRVVLSRVYWKRRTDRHRYRVCPLLDASLQN